MAKDVDFTALTFNFQVKIQCHDYLPIGENFEGKHLPPLRNVFSYA